MKAIIGLLMLLINVCYTSVFAAQTYLNSQMPPERRVQVDRYTGYKTNATLEEVNPLLVMTQINFPSRIQTVHDAIEHALHHSGYRVDWQQSAEAHDVFSELKMPLVHRKLNLMTLKDAITTLSGVAWQILIDSVNRKLIIRLDGDVAWQIASSSKTEDSLNAPRWASASPNEPATMNHRTISSNLSIQAKSGDGSVMTQQIANQMMPKDGGVMTQQIADQMMPKDGGVMTQQIADNEYLRLRQLSDDDRVVTKQIADQMMPGDGSVVTKQIADQMMPGDGGVMTQQIANQMMPKDGGMITQQIANQMMPGDGSVVTKQIIDQMMPGDGGVMTQQIADNEYLRLRQLSDDDRVVTKQIIDQMMPGDGSVVTQQIADQMMPGDGGVMTQQIADNEYLHLHQPPGDGRVVTQQIADQMMPEDGSVMTQQIVQETNIGYRDMVSAPVESSDVPSEQPSITRVDFAGGGTSRQDDLDLPNKIPNIHRVQYIPERDAPRYIQPDSTKLSESDSRVMYKNHTDNQLWSVQPLIKAKEGIGSLDEAVIVHYSSISVKELIEILIPEGWVVHYEVSDAILKQKLVSHAESSRRSALSALFKELNLKALFYPGQAVVLVAEKTSSSNSSYTPRSKSIDKSGYDRASEPLSDTPSPAVSRPQLDNILKDAQTIKNLMDNLELNTK